MVSVAHAPIFVSSSVARVGAGSELARGCLAMMEERNKYSQFVTMVKIKVFSRKKAKLCSWVGARG